MFCRRGLHLHPKRLQFYLTARSIRLASLSSLIRLINKSASPVATPYPALFTRSIKLPNLEISGSYSTVARSEERFTLAISHTFIFFQVSFDRRHTIGTSHSGYG